MLRRPSLHRVFAAPPPSPSLNRHVLILLSCLLVLSLAAASAQEGGRKKKKRNKKTQSSPAQTVPSGNTTEAQLLLDQGDPEGALAMLERLVKGGGAGAETFLLRSTAYFHLGELENGEKDLHKALELDPALRQAWLNLGGLELSRERYGPARSAFEKARALDPGASDVVLNLGVAELLGGELPAASEYFETYTRMSSNSAEAEYLVAKNYAVAGYAALALSSLDRAVRADERNRLRARTDRAFEQLAEDQRYRDLLERDSYKPAPGSFSASRHFETPYEIVDGRLLGAVVDTLKALGVAFSPKIEVTPGWSLVWSDMRIKVAPGPEQKGVVQIIGAPDTFTADQWRARVDNFYARLEYELAPKLPPGVSPRN